jgi:hypothetical protein
MSDESSTAAYNARALADAHEEIRRLKTHLAEMQELGVQLLQLLDGWHVDAASAEWNESLRQRLSAWLQRAWRGDKDARMDFAAYEDPPAYQPE